MRTRLPRREVRRELPTRYNPYVPVAQLDRAIAS